MKFLAEPEITIVAKMVTATLPPVVMDIVYAPLETRLLREAKSAGCEVINGLSMLLYQGVAQFEAWTGEDAPVEVMRAVLINMIS